ncbi:MAG: cation:proton antiporter [Halioglobus sp.]
MSNLSHELITLGGLLLLALCTDAIGRYTRLPRISLLVMLGFLLGPAAFNIIDPIGSTSFDFVALLALSMVGFLMGGKLSLRVLHRSGRLILWISITQVLVTFAVVAAGLLIFSFPIATSLLLAAIATATDPAATLDAIKETGKTSPFTDILTGVVAIDDAWGLIMFSIALIAIQVISSASVDNGVVTHIVSELFGAILLGAILGLPMALLSGRIRKGQPTLMEAAGSVMVCAGMAEWLGVSHLLACVTMGITVTNVARHHTRPFHAVEEIEWPFLALFFIFSGAYLTFESISTAGMLLFAYIVLRISGRLLGGAIAGTPATVETMPARWLGAAMLPQAGVAMAMAFQAISLFPELKDSLLPTVIAATAIFELIGPLTTRWVLSKQPLNPTL